MGLHIWMIYGFVSVDGPILLLFLHAYFGKPFQYIYQLPHHPLSLLRLLILSHPDKRFHFRSPLLATDCLLVSLAFIVNLPFVGGRTYHAAQLAGALDPEVGAVGKVVGAFREEGSAGEGRKRERVWEGPGVG